MVGRSNSFGLLRLHSEEGCFFICNSASRCAHIIHSGKSGSWRPGCTAWRGRGNTTIPADSQAGIRVELAHRAGACNLLLAFAYRQPWVFCHIQPASCRSDIWQAGEYGIACRFSVCLLTCSWYTAWVGFSIQAIFIEG